MADIGHLSLNQRMLIMLRTAPDSQISPYVRALVCDTDLNDPQGVRDTFQAIHALPVTERSSFVATAVDPCWTGRPDYSTPISRPFNYTPPQ